MTVCFEKHTCFIENYFSLQLFLIFFFKVDSIALDPDPSWAEILDPDPNSMCLDPQHCRRVHINSDCARVISNDTIFCSVSDPEPSQGSSGSDPEA